MEKIKVNKEFAKNAHFKSFKEYKDLYDYSLNNFEDFWWKQAKENLTFFEDFSEILDEKDYPFVKWFSWWKVNICYEAVDKNLEKNSLKTAIIFEAESWETKKVSYKELSEMVNKSANLLKNIWVKKWDKVIFYMPQILESVYLMLACLRIWAIHSIVFWWFSAESLKDRIEDLKADFLITADWAFRKWKSYILKDTADEALKKSKHKVKKTLVIKRNFEKVNIQENDIIYNDLIEKQSEICDFEKLESEDISFILYTSWSTWKPKWIIHSSAWYALWAKLTTRWVFDLQNDDVFFSTADIWWITWHTYTVYWPLLNWKTTIIYEWNPIFPKEDRIWEIIEKHKVSKFYTAPTLIRLLHKLWENLPDNFNLESLRVLWTVWEPIDSESWDWYFEKVWKKRASIVDTYWQTETWWHILAPLPFAIDMKKKSASFPLPWIIAEVVDKNGKKVKEFENGFFVIKKPWPSMARWIWWDNKKFLDTYFSSIFKDNKAFYFSWDWAYYDEQWYTFITWRVDDVVNISGHKIWIAEIEDIVTKDEYVAESAVVWIPDEITWESLFWFLVMMWEKNYNNQEKKDLMKKLNNNLRKEIWAIVSIKDILIVEELPKTRSWKIVRRALRSIAKNEEIIWDLSTIENKEVIERIKSLYKKNTNNS